MPLSNGPFASRLIGSPVRDSAGTSIGKIDELVVNPTTGNLEFAILSLQSPTGMKGRLVAVPWRAFGATPGRDYLLLDMDKNVLERAPSFDQGEWPDFTDAAWRARVYGHYGYTEPAVVPTHTTVVRHEYRAPRKETSVFAVLFMLLVVLALFGFGYMVATRGWDQAKTDTLRSLHGAAYAMKETSGDAALTAKVKTAFSLNKRIPAGSIQVESDNGSVTLRGEVNDDQTRAIAGLVAEDTPGVTQVNNHLYVMSPGR